MLLDRVEYIEEGLAVLAVLSQINHIIERLYTNDSEEDLDEQYNKLRQRILDWCEEINVKPEIDKEIYNKLGWKILEWWGPIGTEDGDER